MSSAPFSSLRAVILDWAGTTVDHGCFAPAAVFQRVLAARGVALSVAEARGPMGLMKRDHLRALLALPSITRQWEQAHGRAWTEADVDALFADFVPQQLAVLADYATPIPGAVETVAAFRARGLRVGATTGYTRAMMEVLAPLAAAHGYAPEVWVAADDVPAARPAPWMLYRNLEQLGVYPSSHAVKIGDTVPDIAEGRNAGAWTVAITLTGNEIGLTAAEAAALPRAEREARLAAADERLRAAGAHYVVESLAACLPALEAIDLRLARGERP